MSQLKSTQKTKTVRVPLKSCNYFSGVYTVPPLIDEDNCRKQIATQKFCKAKISVAQSPIILSANLSVLGKTAPLQQGPASVVSELCGRNVTHWPMAVTSAGLPTPVSTLCFVSHLI